MGGAANPEPARDEERAAALALLFRDLPRRERRRRVANALQLVESGELDPAGIFVLREGEHLDGVMVCLPVPGASALVWPPRMAGEGPDSSRENLLVQHGLRWLRHRGVKLAQCLLTPEEVGLVGPLERNGFEHVTHLWYLERRLGGDVPAVSPARQLDFRPYGPDSADAFHEVLLRTYEDSLDCPEVTGLRTVAEIIAGHRAQGQLVPDGWVLAYAAGRPVGVLLLVALPGGTTWELAYVGVVPEARGQGHGREILAHALRTAHGNGASAVTLSVDARNAPARRLYARLGFSSLECREVYIASWR
jgi:ribosomal protein S18 acetylase RimI-like enzyme